MQHELRADHRAREASEVDAGIADLLRQFAGQARFVRPLDPHGVQMFRDGKPDRGGGLNVLVTKPRSHKHHACAGLFR